MKAVIFTLGCRLNAADSALMTSRLQQAGYTVLDPDSPEGTPDLVIVNSCAVTAEAVRKSRQLVRHYRKKFPSAHIAVTGCGAETEGEAWKRDAAANVILPNPAKRDLDALCGKHVFEGGTSFQEKEALFREGVHGEFPFRSRAFIKIQEGCNNFCTYCIVPFVRGPARSRDFLEVLADCRHALEAGFAELVLTGVNTACYHDGNYHLGDLISAVSDLPGDFRIRLGSTEPDAKHPEWLESLRGNSRICRFLHLSLQHGSDPVLRRMNRHYTAQEFADFAARARDVLPGLSLGTDVIAGFPGETEELFEESREFIRKMDFANTHIFRYSPRPGTAAAAFPDRPSAADSLRRSELLKLDADAASARFAERNAGTLAPVIFEEVRDGFLVGWTDHYLQVKVPEGSYPEGRIVQVKLPGA
ncbi:MAG: tRNA (N(6)-L-threonylcarbamoyladenosine(37)-C(2))-methylthiotransferase MtaB [Lentisphaeria bacterium]|nr:tRNA (N(6)-L-threonylcarbamoyladenosine(37)-C(2))-methylthiotransferase MtaB [Lentisphaeria bacterium]